jgi:ubiquinone/menaquinone biosynthesis C-methylase UbiE
MDAGQSSDPQARYVPAAGRAGLTSVYDLAMATTMREALWRTQLIARIAANTPQNGTVADIGAGTGTLAIALADARPDVQVVAIDGDPRVLSIAAAKPGAHRVQWVHGLAGALEVADDGVNAVVMSLLLHHLVPDNKRRVLTDARRMLRADGHLHVADWGAPGDPLMTVAFGALRLLDGLEGTRDHAAGRVGQIIQECGFRAPQRYLRLRTMWGRLELLDAPVESPTQL